MSILDLRRKKKPAPVSEPPLIEVVPVGPQPIRVTDERDGTILNRGYSYNSQVWNKGEDIWFAFCGHADGHPRFFKIEGTAITRLGSLLPFVTTGEGMYWDHEGWIYLCDGPRLLRVNPFTGQQTIALDISQTHPNCDIWQAHSSDDGRTHSATVRQVVSDGPYPKLGTVVQCASGRMFYASTGTLDESQITADGSYIIIKETDEQGRLYNRIISCDNGGDGYLLNPGEAIGHSDCGSDFIVGEDSQVGQCIWFNPQTRERRKLLDTWALGHVSVRAGRCLRSTLFDLSLIALDGSGETHLLEHGMTGEGYDHQVFANLSPDGTVAAWVSNQAGRMDLYVCRV